LSVMYGNPDGETVVVAVQSGVFQGRRQCLNREFQTAFFLKWQSIDKFPYLD